MPAKEKYSLLEDEDDPSSKTPTTTTTTTTNPLKKSQTQDLRKSIGIIVETSPGIPPIMPSLNLDPATVLTAPAITEVPQPIQAVQVKAMKSKAVEQVQDLLKKRRKKNKKNWKQNAVLIAVVLAALAGVLFTLVGVIFHVRFTSKILWSVPAYLYLYLAAVNIFSVIFTAPLANLLVNVWRFSFIYENYIYYYTHGTIRGLHILLAASFPWIYWEYFASQSISESEQSNFTKNTTWVPRIYLSFIVVGACIIGKQILVRVLAGNLQAINYREHVRAVLFLEKVLASLTGKGKDPSASMISHDDLIHSIKNVQNGKAALHSSSSSENSPPSTLFGKLLSQVLFLKGVGIKATTPKMGRNKSKSHDVLAQNAENMAKKIFAKLDKNNNGYLTVESFKQGIHMDPELAQNTFSIFDRNGDGSLTQQELSSVIEEVYLHRRALQHSLKDTKNLEKSLEEVVTSIVAVIAFMALLTVFGVDVQASILSFSVVFLSLGFALGPFLQALIFSIVLIFFVKPFDVGDRISLNNDKEILIVESIGLWVTDTLDNSGKRHYLHNGNLAKDHIVNHTRTSKVDLSFELNLSLDTPKDVLITIKEALQAWTATDSELYGDPSVQISSVAIEKNMITVGISCGLNCSWFDPRRGKARQAFVDLIHSLTTQLGLSYTPPMQQVLVDTESKKDK